MLQHLKQQAINAHNGTSFSPEKRGEAIINEYSTELTGDIQTIREAAAKDLHDATEQINRYEANYEKAFTAWLHAKSRCISSMITGPSNFPVRRAQKFNQLEDNKYKVFREWRRKALKAIEKSFRPQVTVDTELQRYQSQLKGMVKYHEVMKAANVIIRKAKGQDCTDELIKVGLSDEQARKVQLPDFMGRRGFAQFNLSNNTANMKRVRERIAVMEDKKANIETGENREIEFDGGKILLNNAADRLQILYPGKPDYEIIGNLKKHGFRWSPTNTAWQRQLTPAAKHAACQVTGVSSEILFAQPQKQQ